MPPKVGANIFPPAPTSPLLPILLPPSNPAKKSTFPYFPTTKKLSLYNMLLSHLTKFPLTFNPNSNQYNNHYSHNNNKNIGIKKSLFINLQTNQQQQQEQQQQSQQSNKLIHLIMFVILLQLIPFVLVYYIEECSPLVLFSWWRNKIS